MRNIYSDFFAKLNNHSDNKKVARNPGMLNHTGTDKEPNVTLTLRINLNRCIIETSKNIIALALNAVSFIFAPFLSSRIIIPLQLSIL